MGLKIAIFWLIEKYQAQVLQKIVSFHSEPNHFCLDRIDASLYFSVAFSVLSRKRFITDFQIALLNPLSPDYYLFGLLS